MGASLMRRPVRLAEKLLLIGLSLIFVYMVIQDWVPLGSLNDVEAIADERPFNELLIVTSIGAGQILLLLFFVIIFLGKQTPIWIQLWLIIHQVFIFAGALIDWWIPYFFGYGAEERTEKYNKMFGETHHFLPLMNGIVPNTLHIIFHSTLFICIILSVYVTLSDKNNRKREINHNANHS